MENLSGLISSYSSRLLEFHRKYLQMGDKKVRRLTIPVIFKRSWDENFISDYLAYILDPEKNGIGLEPLQALLTLTYDDIDEVDFSQVNIIREYTFKTNPNLGRIDFVIELGEGDNFGIIGIENKIFSSEGENQTTSYVHGLKSDYPNQKHFMIFLTPTGLLPKAKQFKQVSYADFVIELRKIQYPVLKDIHKTVIWEDFLNHIEEFIVMSKGKLELSGKTLLYLENQDMLSDINASFKDDSQKVYDYVTSSIKNKIGSDWYFNFQGRNEFQEITRESWRKKKYYFFLQFFFSRESLLLKKKVGFMLGVYPKNDDSNQIYNWLQVNKPEIIDICRQYQMISFPRKLEGTGGYVVAYKEYPLVIDPKDISGIDKPFTTAIEEFSTLQIIIGTTLQNYNNHDPI